MFQLNRLGWGGGWWIYEIPGIPGAIAAKGIGRAVDRVRAGLEADVNHCAGATAEFGGGIVFDVQFLDGIDGQDGGGVTKWQRGVGDALAGKGIVAIEAFEEVIVILRLESVRRSGQRSAAWGGQDARAEHQQILKVAAVHGQIDDGSRVKRSTDDGAGRIQHRGGRGHFHGLCDLARRQLSIDASILADSNGDVLALEGLKAHRASANAIGSRDSGSGRLYSPA